MISTSQNASGRSSARLSAPRPVVLCILDGWGHREERADNAIAQANLPNWRQFLERYPHALLNTSGLEVGLPDGQMGNSEVGHMNLGAGRVVMQDLPRIDEAIADGSLAKNTVLLDRLARVKQAGGTVHLLGLLSPGGVHSHQDHMAGLARIAAAVGVPVRVHAFLDGRDTPPSSAKDFVAKFEADVAGLDIKIATVSGRYFAMDRDKRWDRVTLAYDALVQAKGQIAADAQSAIDQSYGLGKTDEFVAPTVVGEYAGMADGDGLLMANFRADRAREILEALVDPDFSGFERGRTVTFSAKVGLTEYSSHLEKFMTTLFPAEQLSKILGEVVSEAGLSQLRIAETEKYAHVTFFFNGGREQVYPGEDRILVPSPKVATYDLDPAMSAEMVTDELVAAIGSGKYDLIVVNFANGDMVGHTGILSAAIAAAETVDRCLGRLEAALKGAGGTMLIAADHGNAEQMKDPETGEPHTAHTTGPVDTIVVNPPAWVEGIRNGRLADVAPTVLTLLGLPQPDEMTGRVLLKGTPAASAPLRAFG